MHLRAEGSTGAGSAAADAMTIEELLAAIEDAETSRDVRIIASVGAPRGGTTGAVIDGTGRGAEWIPARAA